MLKDNIFIQFSNSLLKIYMTTTISNPAVSSYTSYAQQNDTPSHDSAADGQKSDQVVKPPVSNTKSTFHTFSQLNMPGNAAAKNDKNGNVQGQITVGTEAGSGTSKQPKELHITQHELDTDIKEGVLVPNDLSQYKVIVDADGKIAWRDLNGRLANNGDVRFVIHKNGEIYMGDVKTENEVFREGINAENEDASPTRPLRPRFHHASLVGNEWPIYAGRAFVSNGVILYLNNHTGHFAQPKSNFDEVFPIFEEKGIDVRRAKELWFDGNLYDPKNSDAPPFKLKTPLKDNPNAQAWHIFNDSNVGRVGISPNVYREQVGIQPPVLEQLKALDNTQPKLRIGEVEVSRVKLYEMGAMLDGRRIDASSLSRYDGAKLAQNLQFSSGNLIDHLKANSSEKVDRATVVLYEVANQRTENSPALVHMSGTESANETAELKKIESSASNAAKQRGTMVELESANKPVKDLFSPAPSSHPNKSAPITKKPSTGAGLGLLAFSTWTQIRDSMHALRNGQTTEGIVGIAGAASDYAGLSVEQFLQKASQAALKQTAPSANLFRTTSAGKLLGRVAGPAGALVTTPFDIYSAITNFNKAANSSGKEAQDYYVAAAASVTSAVVNIVSAGAVAAGFGPAAPIAFAVQSTIALGMQIYSAVRKVEDIDTVTPLNVNQRWRTGLNAFFGVDPDFDVQKPYLETTTVNTRDALMRKRLTAILDESNAYESAVYGSVQAKTELKPVKLKNHPFGDVTEAVPHTTITDGSDTIYASKGLSGVANVVQGKPGNGKGVLWDLGGGDDQVEGVEAKSNHFRFGPGQKILAGGNQGNIFELTANAREMDPLVKDDARHASFYKGGKGNDSLILSGDLTTTHLTELDPVPLVPGVAVSEHRRETSSYPGHVIDLNKGNLFLKTKDGSIESNNLTHIAKLQSIENVSTAKGGSSHVYGTKDANVIVANGDDTVYAGDGDDTIISTSTGTLNGGAGKDTYRIMQGPLKGSGGPVTIEEDGNDQSIIYLDWRKDELPSFTVEGNDLKLHLAGSRVLTIENVYRGNGHRRTLKNDKLMFVTQDGYLIFPNLPQTYSRGSEPKIPVS